MRGSHTCKNDDTVFQRIKQKQQSHFNVDCHFYKDYVST